MDADGTLVDLPGEGPVRELDAAAGQSTRALPLVDVVVVVVIV